MSEEIIPLSAAVITKNEEKNLPAFLRSVSFADDIVVVDSGSTDRTVEIAKEFGCRVFVEEWKGFGPQKNSAVDKCRHKWVLLLDADERVPAETIGAIRTVIKNPTASAYRFAMKHYLHGKWIRHAGYWPDRHIRLFIRDTGSFRGLIHETWETAEKVHDLNVYIEHYAFSDYADMLETLDEYSTIMAGHLFASGRRVTPLTPLFHGLAAFFKIYLLQKGFLAGLDGLIIALTKAGGSFFKYAKLLELRMAQKK